MLRVLALIAATPLSHGDSIPGYWQQGVAYRIAAALDEPSGVLSGHARITYTNHSPDTLRDFFVHQYLNAFRPGSRWSAADSAEGRVRFQHLHDPDYAFERIQNARVMGTARKPDYPYAPDSTIAHWSLPRPLAPGDSMTVEIDWQARPSTLPRRQGRAGRRFDFAQWYPKVVVYDRYGWEDHPLYPAGEFYGEFATFDVMLDLPQDQVIGATGVPVEGDPGWEHAKADANFKIDYQRDYYGRSGGQAVAQCGEVSPGRKCVHFHAEQVHHFAFSLNPQYVYEEGRYGRVVARVLYQPQDSGTWGHGIAVQRTVTALAWLDSLYGPFAWPQMTNVHRIEGGGTEFPMMVMDGGASLGLILHEVGHNYTMGVLANNEWREGYLDEGFTSFQTGWYFQTHGGGDGYLDLEYQMTRFDVDRWSEPVSMVSERYRDFPTYNNMIYSKAQLFYEQLRYVVGDAVMRRILRTYYARWQLKHVDEVAFQSVCEEVSGMDLKWLFSQWLHGTPLIDYRIKAVSRQLTADGHWLTTVTIQRLGDGFMPVEIADRDSIYARSIGQAEVEQVSFVSSRRPGRLRLDPRARAHDWNMTNNMEPRGPFHDRRLMLVYLDDPTHERVRRDREVNGLLPVAWFNDYGGVTVAIRSRTNYLDRFNQNLSLVSFGTDAHATQRYGFYARFANPVNHPMPRSTTSVTAWSVEGRSGAELSIDRSLQRRPIDASDPHVGMDALWMATTDVGYVDRRLWDDAGTIEAGPWIATTIRRGATRWHVRVGARGGVVYRFPGQGIVSENRYDIEGFFRATAEASLRRRFVAGTELGVRVFGGAYAAQTRPPLQRRIMVSGAGPYETVDEPLLRSRGALFVRPGFHYQEPGDANLRGFAPDLGGRWAASANLELSRGLVTRPRGVLRSVALLGFVDAGVVDSAAVPSATGRRYTTLYDGGVGLVTRHQLRDLSWTMRFEMPLAINRWDFAADRTATPGRLKFRWQVSLAPSF